MLLIIYLWLLNALIFIKNLLLNDIEMKNIDQLDFKSLLIFQITYI